MTGFSSFAVDPATRILSSVSAAEVALFDASRRGGCQRRWWFEVVGGLAPAATKTQLAGVEVRRQVSHYLRTGEDTLGPVARHARRFLMPPGPGLLLEVPVDGLVFAGIPWVGTADVVHAEGYWLDDEGERQSLAVGGVEVQTHVFAGDLRRHLPWASSPADAIEAVAQAEWVSRRWPGVSELRVSHNHFQMRGRYVSHKRSAIFPLATTAERWERLREVVRDMTAAARAARADDLPPNYDACGVGGWAGCSHASYCPRSIVDRLVADSARRNAMSSLDLGDVFGVPQVRVGGVSSTPSSTSPSTSPSSAPQSAFGVTPVLDPAAVAAAKATLLAAEAAGGYAAVRPPDAPASAPAAAAAAVTPEVKATLAPAVQAAVTAHEEAVAQQQAAVAAGQGPLIDTGRTSAMPAAQAVPARGQLSIPGTEPTDASSVTGAAGVAAAADGGVLKGYEARLAAWWAVGPALGRAPFYEQAVLAEAASVVLVDGKLPKGAATTLGRALAHLGWERTTFEGKVARAVYLPPGTTKEQAVAIAASLPNPEGGAGSAGSASSAPAAASGAGGEDVRGLSWEQVLREAVAEMGASLAPVGVVRQVVRDAVAATGTFVLFVDCPQVVGVAVTDLEPYVAAHVERLRAALTEQLQRADPAAEPVDDLRTAPRDSAFGFNKWQGFLAAAVREKPPQGFCAIHYVEGNPFKEAVVGALAPLAAFCVRGSR